MKNNIAVLGTGAWGTALANVLALSKNNVIMWGIDEKEVLDINKGYNKRYFNTKLSKNIKATLDLNEALKDVRYVLIAIPSKYLKGLLYSIVNELKNKPIFINVSKGLDPETNNPLMETLKSILKNKVSGVASLIGPSFANEVINKKPTIINCVCNDQKISKEIISLFNCKFFKVKPVEDEIGSEFCGALKNLLAIGVGIAHQNHNSINTISALLTMGINEIKEIIKSKKGNPETILDLCGIGDIFLTCTSKQSRNFSFGISLYKYGLEKTLEKNKNTVEGYSVYKIVENIIGSKKEQYPIFWSICKVLSGEIKAKNFVDNCISLIGMKEE